jgi:hypothetical protein
MTLNVREGIAIGTAAALLMAGIVLGAMPWPMTAAFGAPPGAAAETVGQSAGAITVESGNRSRTLTPDDIAALPAVDVKTAFRTEHGQHAASFAGPLLWRVLQQAGVLDGGKTRDHVRQIVRITGRDGYTAVLALAELDPEFENKPVILAVTEDGSPLSADHLRIVVAGDQRGGRSVRDVVRLSVE